MQSFVRGLRPRDLGGDIPVEYARHFVDQEHAAYTSTDQDVWREVLARNTRLIAEHGDRIHPAYMEGMELLQLPKRVPRLEEINDRLTPTGWRAVCVDGYIPASAYVGLMAQSVFPISRRIRRREHIDYAPAPDMVHDILGHLPMLFSPEHRDFMQRLAAVTHQAAPSVLDLAFYEANRQMSDLKAIESTDPELTRAAEEQVLEIHRALQNEPSELTWLSRMYLWAIEFGLLSDGDRITIHGAALLSSPEEFRAICAGGARLLPYSLDVIHRDIAFSELQTQYFVARDFGQLHDVLTEYEIGRIAPPAQTSIVNNRARAS